MVCAWRPQPGAQLAAIQAREIDILLYGGSRGGGKTDYLLGDFLQDVEVYKDKWRGILFRRSYSELEEIITRSKELFTQTGANYSETKKTWTFPNGATLKLRFLESAKDAIKYQGHQYTWIGWDELGNWSNLEAFHMLRACLRQARGVAHKRIRASANPGGAGHHAVKSYFIEHAPLGYKIKIENTTGAKICYIPSQVFDNKILLENDPNYINVLKGVGSKSLVEAWLYGNWDIIQGAYFDTFSTDKHVIEPFKIPEHWLKFRAFDWGSHAPSACLWFAVADGNTDLPRGSLVVYKELYTMDDKPNKGLKLTVEEVADRIKDLTVNRIDYSVADPSIFKEEGGESIGEKFYRCGVHFKRADNVRIAGWEHIRARLNAEKPTLYFFSTCINLIRTLPALQHDDKMPEDLDTNSEDHLCFGGDTLVDTKKGQIKIKDLVNKKFKVNTRYGYKMAIGYKTGYKRLYEVVLSNGKCFNATIDHKLLTVNGWQELANISIGDYLIESKRNIKHYTRVQQGKILQVRGVFQQAKQEIERFIKVTQRGLQVLSWSITRRYAYSSQGWEQVKQSNREFGASKCKDSLIKAYDESKKERISYQYSKTTRESERVAQVRRGQEVAQRACKESSQEYKTSKKTMLLVSKRVFNKVSKAFSLLSSKLQDASEKTRVISIRPKGINEVFCLYVPKYNEFTIESGIVVHNCDALRYGVNSRAVTKDKPKKRSDKIGHGIEHITANQLMNFKPTYKRRRI